MTAHQPGHHDGGIALSARQELIRQRLRPAARPHRMICRADRASSLPLSAGQQQMWVLHRLDPASPAYLMTWVLRLSGPLDAEALARAWERIVERHEILRTRYAQDGDEPVQIIDPPGGFAVRVIDLAHEPPARRERRARQIADWQRTRPFDLTTEHPIRVSLIAAGPGLHLLVVSVHHIACDGAQRITAEFNEAYAAHAAGRPADLPELPVQYADFAAWQVAARRDGALRPHLDYWRDALSGVASLPLILPRPGSARPDRPDRRGGAVESAFKPEVCEGLRALASEHRATLYIVLLAAYHALLREISGSSDVTVGVPVSVRTAPELDGLVGYLANTVVVRSRHTGEETFERLLAQVKERFLEAFDHRAAPFAWVVDEVNPQRADAGNPLFQACFDMERYDEDVFRLPGVQVEYLDAGAPPAAKFDLTLHIAQTTDRLFARLEYAAAVIDQETAQAWATRFEELLDAVVRHPREPLARLLDQSAARARAAAWTGEVEPAPADDRPATRTATATAADIDDTETDGEGSGAARDGRLAVIRRVWSEVLGVDRVHVHDNFFDAGGDSLRAVSLAGLLKAEGLDISAADVFTYQTIGELAEARARPVRAHHGPNLGEAPRAIAPFALLNRQDRDRLPPGVVDAYPLAATQLGMIVELRARPDVNTYQDTTSYLIRDDRRLDLAALQQAAQLVVDRHEVLRTGFEVSSYTVPLQLVYGEAAIVVRATDHGVLPPEGWMPGLEAYAARERRSPMDLARPPLIRVHAHTAADRDEWWITITECHPILEGWSFHSMLMEILSAYHDLRDGRAPALPQLPPFRFADYIAAEAAARRSDEDREYWRAVVEGRADAALPLAWQDGPQTPRERYQHLVLFRDLEPDLRRLAAETRTSLKAVLLAAHLKVMSMIAGSQDFYTGLVCDARPEAPGADRVLGMYLNTLPIAMPAGARTWGELVRLVYDELTAMWPHRVFPMQEIQQAFGPGGRLLDICFNYLDFHQVDKRLIEWDRTYNDNDNEFALHVFTVSGVVKLNTTNHCLNRASAQRLGALYRSVLEEMALGPHGDADSPCLPAEERALACPDQPFDMAVRRDARTLGVRQLEGWLASGAQRLQHPGVEGGLAVMAPSSDPAAQPRRDVVARVVDSGLRPVAAGVVGELCLAGTALTGAFEDDPARTAERFAPDPAGHGGSRLFRTGQLARLAAEGRLEPLGPIEQRTRRDGFPVQLDRTRQLLDSQPSILDSWVRLRADPRGGEQQLTAYVRTASGAPLDAEQVRRSLAARRLPRQLIPDRLVCVEQWPLAADGTIDADRLPEPIDATGEPAPRKPWDDRFEALLRQALTAVPPGQELAADTPLTDSGLGSLQTVGLLVSLEQEYGIAIPDDFHVMDMFRTPRTLWETVAALLAGTPAESRPAESGAASGE